MLNTQPCLRLARNDVDHPKTIKELRTRDTSVVLEVDEHEFDQLVAQALDEIPPEIAELMTNVVVMVEADPPSDDPHLLGLYEGTPLTERDDYSGVLPDMIRIFRTPILRMCDTYDDIVHEVKVTVVHEVAHHFGIEDDRLHELGWG